MDNELRQLIHDYYYEKFRTQFEEWVRNTNAHEHPGEGVYISLQELKQENLEHIPRGDHTLFRCALALTVLIDQVIYTHFNTDYPLFQQMTQYPKIEYGITNVNVNPWHIVRGTVGSKTFENFANFFLEDLRNFFESNQFEEVTWDAVKAAMLSDTDVTRGHYGNILKEILENHTTSWTTRKKNS